MKNWKLVQRAAVNDQKWNKVVEQSKEEHIYGYTYYLDAVGAPWLGCILGDYEAVLPLFRKKKMGLSYLCQTHHVQRSAVYSTIELPKTYGDVAKCISSLATEFDFMLVNDVELNLDVVKRSNYVLNLNRPISEIRKSYSKNLVRKINSGKRQGFELLEFGVNGLNQAINIFQEEKNFDLTNEWYESLRNVATEEYAQTYGLKIKNMELAYVLLVRSQSRITLLFTAQTEMGRKLNGMSFLIDAILEKFANQDVLFDFEGSEKEGLVRFYKSYGAEKETYFHYQSNGMIKRLKSLLKGK